MLGLFSRSRRLSQPIVCRVFGLSVVCVGALTFFLAFPQAGLQFCYLPLNLLNLELRVS